MKSKVVFIIPGHKHKPNKNEYKQVSKFFQEKDIKPISVFIPWNRTTISDNVKYFLDQYEKVVADKKYFFGFSFGAVIAFIASTKVKADLQILCSLSPYFQEDLPSIKKSWYNSLGKRRQKDFATFNNAAISDQVNTETILLYGTKEGSEVEKRAKETFNNLHCKKQIIAIGGVKHDIRDKRYEEQIRKVISTIK